MDTNDNTPTTSSADLKDQVTDPALMPIQSSDIPPPVFLRYNPAGYSHMASRMMSHDCVAREMYNSGPKGVDRVKIAAKMGINACLKGGNRKVSTLIQNVCRGLPNEAGMYQKMVGKFRVHNFYHKSFKPNAFFDLVNDISNEIGRDCPFQIGQCIEFPGTKKLTRMRVTDVALKRMLQIIRTLKEKNVVLLRDLSKLISTAELSEGTDFQIDRRTIQKICYALESADLAKMHVVKVMEDDTEKECELMLLCKADIVEATDKRIRQTIVAIQKQYHEEGRIFPGGQVKKRENRFKKPSPTTPKFIEQKSPWPEKPQFDDSTVTNPTMMDVNDPTNNITFEQLARMKAERLENLQITGTCANFSQKKMIKLHVLHQYLFRLIYHPDLDSGLPTVVDRFGSDEVQRLDETPEEEMVIYDTSLDSFFRFVPPLPPLSDEFLQGWFELRLAIRAMPLSVFALIIDTEIDEVFTSYLNDPIKRHILIYDLPYELRKLLVTKKTVLNLDVQCLQLCGLGLLLSAPKTRGIFSGQYSMYYVKSKAFIYDTSTAEKAYAIINEPPEKFNRHDYYFNDSKDVQRFWYHLRAISLSTSLNSKKLREAEREKEIVGCKKFAKESYTKEAFTPPSFEDIEWISPELPGKGAALVDPGLFIHLKRHWDMISVKKPYIEWYMGVYQKEGEECRSFVEEHVEVLNKFWLSIMQLMFTGGHEILFKKRPGKRKLAEDEEPPEVKKKRIQMVRNVKMSSGKRCLDLEDIESSNKSQTLRNRFTNREREFMVLMRAVGQFLNPTAKLWIDPQVMRRIMKSYLEESSYKTMLCLMSASCREVSNPQRVTEIWHLVRGLASFTQMRRIRNQLATVMREDFNKKAEYFCQAFDIAYRLVTCDIPRLPSPLIRDTVFNSILDRNHLTIGGLEPQDSIPSTMYPPQTELDIKNSLMYNWILNVLLNESNNIQNSIVPCALNQRGNEAFYDCLEKMLNNGVAVRTRADLCPSIKFKNHIAVSGNFCYYFSHIYRNDIWENIESLPQDFSDNLVGYSDDFAAFLRITYCLMNDESKVEIDIGEDAFPNSNVWDAETSKRNLRDTENSAMRLNAITFDIDSTALLEPEVRHVFDSYKPHPLPEVSKIDEYGSDQALKSFCEKLNDDEKAATIDIVASLRESGIYGKTLVDLKMICMKHSIPDKSDLIQKLENSFIIFSCGIDAIRYVHISRVLDWALDVDGKAIFVKPWTNADGSVDYSTLRWMAEMVFVTINESPDMSLEYLRNFFANVLHPSNIDDIVEFLLASKMIEQNLHEVSSVTFVNPFEKIETIEQEATLRATYNGMEIFGRVFQGIGIPEVAKQKQQEGERNKDVDDDEDDERDEEERQEEFEDYLCYHQIRKLDPSPTSST